MMNNGTNFLNIDAKRSFAYKMQNKSCLCPFNQVFVIQISFYLP